MSTYTMSGAELGGRKKMYRYALWRGWRRQVAPGAADPTHYRYVLFVGLNPSTADDRKDDPTIRREVDFADRMGFEVYVKVNLFALRAKDRGVMLEHHEPIGPENDASILYYAARSKSIVAAWGNDGAHMGRAERVTRILAPYGPVLCLGKNADGSPKHPLYLPKTAKQERYA